jgi:hypothetical protein
MYRFDTGKHLVNRVRISRYSSKTWFFRSNWCFKLTHSSWRDYFTAEWPSTSHQIISDQTATVRNNSYLACTKSAILAGRYLTKSQPPIPLHSRNSGRRIAKSGKTRHLTSTYIDKTFSTCSENNALLASVCECKAGYICIYTRIWAAHSGFIFSSQRVDELFRRVDRFLFS